MLLYETACLAFRLQFYFSVASTASLPALVVPPISCSGSSVQLNSTTPVNLTLLNSPSNTLPNDPCYLAVPRTNLVVEFYNYGSPVAAQATYRTLQTAIEDVLRHIWYDPYKGDVKMMQRPRGYAYGTGSARLLLTTNKNMTWGMWGDTLRALRVFWEMWEFVRLQFTIVENGEVMGIGQLCVVE